MRELDRLRSEQRYVKGPVSPRHVECVALMDSSYGSGTAFTASVSATTESVRIMTLGVDGAEWVTVLKRLDRDIRCSELVALDAAVAFTGSRVNIDFIGSEFPVAEACAKMQRHHADVRTLVLVERRLEKMAEAATRRR